MQTNKEPNDHNKPDLRGNAPSAVRWRRAFVATSALGCMLLSGIAMLPTLVMQTSYRNTVLSQGLSRQGLSASCESASGSWLKPLAFNGVQISDQDGRVDVTIQSLRISKSLLQLLWDRSDLGTITLVRPSVKVMLDENGRLPLRQQDPTEDQLTGADPDGAAGKRVPSLAFEVQQSELKLSVPWRRLPIVDIADVDISGQIRTTADGSLLTIRPIQIFDHEPLSEAHAEQNLALIAPVLSQTTTLSGQVSVRIEETNVLLNSETQPPVILRGSAIFHSVSAILKQEWSSQLAGLLNQVSRSAVPDRLEIVRDSGVAFRVDPEGIHHEGLAFLLPQMSSQLRIESSGVVGLDEHLDLALRLQFPQVIPQSPFMKIMSSLMRQPLTIQVKGTVSKPEMVMPEGFAMVDELAQRLSPTTTTPPPPQDVPGAVMELISSAASPAKAQSADNLPGNILNLIRSIRNAKQQDDGQPVARKKGRRKREAAPPEPPQPALTP